jgi:hypothetical protein
MPYAIYKDDCSCSDAGFYILLFDGYKITVDVCNNLSNTHFSVIVNSLKSKDLKLIIKVFNTKRKIRWEAAP